MQSLNFDEYQKEAVYSDKKNIVVIAAPGSGKTTVIIGRLYYLINIMKINIKNIAVLTFTKAAAENMKTRFINSYSSSELPFIGTIHSFYYNMLKNSGHNIKVIDESTAYKIINRYISKFVDISCEKITKEILNNISRYKNSFEKKTFKPSIDEDIFRKSFNYYEEVKSSLGLWDFDDMANKSFEVLSKNDNLRKAYRDKFKFMLVDEFQDCDELQIEFLKLIGKHNSLFAVGDEDQSIYGFRGANPSCMLDFSENFEYGQKYYLSTNYRSPYNVVGISRNLIEYNKNRNFKKIIPYNKNYGKIKTIQSNDESTQSDDIINIIKQLYRSGYSYKDIAILYRTNNEGLAIIEKCIISSIPFMVCGEKYNFFEHFICMDILAYLRLSIDNTNADAFIRIINKPQRFVSKRTAAAIKNNILKQNCFFIIKNKIKSIYIYKNICQMESKLKKIKKLNPYEATKFILKKLKYYEYIKEISEITKVPLEDYDKVICVLLEQASKHKTIYDFISFIDKIKNSLSDSKMESNEDSIFLSSIHRAKGMEFKNVIILNCVDGNIPCKKDNDVNIEEERRIFYVGITRTKENLWIFAPKYFEKSICNPSEFIRECGLEF